MKTFTTKTLTLAGGLLMSGCLMDKDGDEAAKAKARFDIRAASTSGAALAKMAEDSATLTMVDDNGLTFHVTEARTFVGKVKLIGAGEDACDSMDDSVYLSKLGDDDDRAGGDDDSTGSSDCEDDGRNSKVGPFVIDLLTGATTPSMGDITVDAGSYRKVKFHLDHAQESDGILPSGDPLLEKTLVVKGSFRLAGDTVDMPFSLSLKFNEEVEMEALAAMVLDPNTLNTILVRLRMDGWLDGLEVGDCLADAEVKASLANGVVISENSALGKCLDVEKTVKRNIRASFRVAEDNSGTGSI